MSQQDTTNLAMSGTRSTALVQASLHASAPQRSIERARRNMRNATIGLTFLVGFCLPQCAPIAFAHTNAPLPPECSAAAWHSLVEGAGRAIAWARWEKHLSLEKTRSAPFRPNTPAWVIDFGERMDRRRLPPFSQKRESIGGHLPDRYPPPLHYRKSFPSLYGSGSSRARYCASSTVRSALQVE